MRRLYFDIDGTVLILDTGEPKPALIAGRLETAIRNAGFDEIVCVGNFVGVAHAMRAVKPGYDSLGVIFALCRGVFQDESWFRQAARLALDPKNRALEIDLESDWWYMDDLAREYMMRAGLHTMFEREEGRRILVPGAEGDGSDVLARFRGQVGTTGKRPG